MLFFGCRNRKHDYIYEDELLGYKDNQTLTQLHVAFSREQGHKVYVQDKLEEPETRETLWHYLNDKNGYFYVCGYVALLFFHLSYLPSPSPLSFSLLSFSLLSFSSLTITYRDARVMEKAVHHALVKIVQECGHKTEEEANVYVDNLQKSGRYLKDVWF